MASIRTFIAFDTPDYIRNKMRILQDELKNSHADVKWESLDKFHATIKFLGNVEEALLPKVLSTCEQSLSTGSSFGITYQSLGCFPNKQHPRVIWIGSDNPDGKLIQIKNTLDKALLSFGFGIEDHRFHPHITLGRIRTPKGFSDLLPMLENLTFHRCEAVIEEILIFKSILKPEGSSYSIIKTIRL